MRRRPFLQSLAKVAVTLGTPLAGMGTRLLSLEERGVAVFLPLSLPRSPESSEKIVEKTPVIKILGVGGAGGRAAELMIRQAQLKGVQFVTIDTAEGALSRSSAATKIRLGSPLGDGIRSESGGLTFQSDECSRIASALHGADMVIIIAGMGGGTATLAAPVIAAIAQEQNSLTLALVTQPTIVEGQKCKALANQGISNLLQHVDSMVIVDNEEMLSELKEWGEPVTLQDTFTASDRVLHRQLRDIVDIVNNPSLVSVTFADIDASFRKSGRALTGNAGPSVAVDDEGRVDSIRTANCCAIDAIPQLELQGVGLLDARKIVVSIRGDASLGMDEVSAVLRYISTRASPHASIIVGTVYTDILKDFFSVSVTATDFPGQGPGQQVPI